MAYIVVSQRLKLKSTQYHFTVGAITVSLAVHFLGFVSMTNDATQEKEYEQVVVKFVDNRAPKKIIETELTQTEQPELSDYFGRQNHIAKEVSIPSGKENSLSDVSKSPRRNMEPKYRDRPKSSIGSYQQLIPSADKLGFIDDVKIGGLDQNDSNAGSYFDINTTEFRYIGYFSSLRRGIELVWSYPWEAARKGWNGIVHMEFTIHENGSVTEIKVLKSSGYRALDGAVVEAIQNASPFAPLPISMNKKRIIVTGQFSYVGS
ncbi:MAG: hypothetical protein CMP10_11015 [Zetaproteobacteria bacterium]|nr:hypothetical protein [Pseudobdellovibrionaceae bacterium]